MTDTHPIPPNPRFKSLLGLTFGKWTVVGYAGGRQYNHSGLTHYWNCRCECGAVTDVAGDSLKRGLSTGCRACSNRHRPPPPRVKHGLCDSITYSSWKAMNQRCHNPRTQHYSYYGGRGIVVCDRWRLSFEAFLADMGERPSLDHSIDRFPDNNGNYEPGNCRWATRSEQQRNKRAYAKRSTQQTIS